MKILAKLSIVTLIVLCSAISIYRISNVNKNEIAWDVLGYYLYLPATFVHHDPLLNDISWLKQTNAERKLAGTLYMVSQNKKGETMYFFLMGLALFYLPFFFMAHSFASIAGFASDGFSMPYQYFLVAGGIVYTIIGLIFLRKILRRFFSEGISSLVMLIIVLGTNYINHLTIDNLATINVIFMLTTIVIWNTIKWHENNRPKHLIAMGVGISLVTLVKPSEIFLFLIPLLWNVTSMEDLKQKFITLFSSWKNLLITAALCLLVFAPQMVYWYLKTGRLIYDSYVNPGVGLDFLSPHISNVLFSYRKGWLLYTPVVIFALVGFYFLYKSNRKIFLASITYFLVSFYVISSWSEWWYGAAYSTRPLIATYPILGICLGYFLIFLRDTKQVVRVACGVVIVAFVFLNQFQWWQYKNYILDPYRSTKEYYWATFLKTNVTPEDVKLLSVYRDFTGKMEFSDSSRYNGSTLLTDDFSGNGFKPNMSENTNSFYRLTEEQEYFPFFETPFNELTQTDHIWIKASIDVRFPEIFEGKFPCLVLSMERKNGPYGYSATEIKTDSLPNRWRRIQVMYLSPEIRSVKDRVKCYIWKRGKTSFDIDNVKLEVFKRK
jgi:hypothetical protein